MKATLALALICSTTGGKPPRMSYDSAKDVTTYKTGTIRTGEKSGMAAEFEFAGKTPTRPDVITMGIGSLRVKDEEGGKTDQDLLHWKAVDHVDFQYGNKDLKVPATEGWRVSKNTMATLTYGHSVEEYVTVHLTPTQFVALTQQPQFTIQIGSESRPVSGKTLDTLRKLAGSLPD